MTENKDKITDHVEYLTKEIEHWIDIGMIPESLGKAILKKNSEEGKKYLQWRKFLKENPNCSNEQKHQYLISSFSQIDQKKFKQDFENSIQFHDFLFKHKSELTLDLDAVRSVVVRNSTNPEIWLQAAYSIVDHLASKDPLPAHFAVARQILQQEKTENDNQAVDMLARELVKQCERLKKKVMGKRFATLNENGGRIYLCGGQIEMGLIFSKNNMLEADHQLLALLEKIGDNGKKGKEELTEKWKKRYLDSYKNGNKDFKTTWKIWIDPDKPLSPPFLQMLCKTVWLDVVKSKWERSRKNVPALSKGVFNSTTSIFTKDLKVSSTEEEVFGVYNNEITFHASVPMVEKDLIPILAKGASLFNTLLAQKLIRFQSCRGFKKWINKEEDPRLDIFEGGVEEIAELLGVGNNRRAITDLNALLEAQANLRICSPEFKDSSMIILHRVLSKRTGKETKIQVVYGVQLVPEYVHTLRKGEKLLIPLTETLPPFVSAHRYHAPQALLQSQIIGEFSDQSIQLAKEGSIHLPDEKWEDLSKKSSVPTSLIPKIQDRWIQDGDDAPAFLELIEPEHYTLSKAYSDELSFLEKQGNIRIDAQKRAKAGKIKKQKKERKKRAGTQID